MKKINHTTADLYFARAEDMPFTRHGLARTGHWLAQLFGLNGLVAMPPAPLWREETPLDQSDIKDLAQFSDAIAEDIFSFQPDHRYNAEGEPLFLRLLRRHDGLSALPRATLFPFSAPYLARLMKRAHQYDFNIVTPENALSMSSSASGHKCIGVDLARLTDMTMVDIEKGHIQISPGTSWPALAAFARPHGFFIPTEIEDRFRGPFDAALAGLFKIIDKSYTEAILTGLTLCLDKHLFTTSTAKQSKQVWHDRTYLFDHAENAMHALLDITDLTHAFYIELIPAPDIELGAHLGYWSLGLKHSLHRLLKRPPSKPIYTGLRVIYANIVKPDETSSSSGPNQNHATHKTSIKLSHKIMRHYGGVKWHKGPLMHAREKAAALLFSGAAEVSHPIPIPEHQNTQTPKADALTMDMTAAKNIISDSVIEASPFNAVTPIASISLTKTYHAHLVAQAHVLYPRDPSRSAAEWRDIHNHSVKQMNTVLSTDISPSPTQRLTTDPQHPPTIASEQPDVSEEWQAIREALLSDFGHVGVRKNGHE